jgi:hypothetical protein
VPADLSGDVLAFLKLRTWGDTGIEDSLLHGILIA